MGDDPELLMPTFRSTPDLTEVVVFCEDGKADLQRLERVCTSMSVMLRPVKVKNAFDLVSIAKDMKREVRRIRTEGGRVAVFNIAGGTRIMSAAALLVSTIDGLNAVYVHDDTKKEIPLPLLRVDYSLALNTKQREILEYLLASEGRQRTQKEISDHMGLHKATVNHHIQAMVEKGAVRVIPKPDNNRAKLVVAEESMELLFEVSR
jgi:DNA-binding MarR family transcriptional regulator